MREQVDAFTVTELVGPSSLTTAELRVLSLMPTHLSFREMGNRLHVSANTVKTHAHAVYRKLDVCSRSEAVVRARETGADSRLILRSRVPYADSVDMTAEEFRELFRAVSNWGRWSDGGRRGALNHLTRDRIAAALRLRAPARRSR